MKRDIHPKYYKKAKVRCSCGAVFEIGSTLPDLKVELCSKCHPLYTGNKKLLDTAGRLDRFQERLNKTKKIQEQIKEQAKHKKSAQAKGEESSEGKPESKKEKSAEGK